MKKFISVSFIFISLATTLSLFHNCGGVTVGNPLGEVVAFYDGLKNDFKYGTMVNVEHIDSKLQITSIDPEKQQLEENDAFVSTSGLIALWHLNASRMINGTLI